MKIIVFRHNPGLAPHHAYEEEMEFEDDVTEEEINEAYIDWIIEKVGDSFTWYEKEQ